MHKFYGGIKARPTLTVLPCTLGSILKGTKTGSCSCCDKGNTSSETNEHWGVLGKDEGPRERSREVWSHRHKRKTSREPHTDAKYMLFDMIEWSKCGVSVRQSQHQSPMDAFGNLDPDLFGALEECCALGLIVNGQPFLLIQPQSSGFGSLCWAPALGRAVSGVFFRLHGSCYNLALQFSYV